MNLILQMQKLSTESIHNLPKDTEIVSGRAGPRARQSNRRDCAVYDSTLHCLHRGNDHPFSNCAGVCVLMERVSPIVVKHIVLLSSITVCV